MLHRKKYSRGSPHGVPSPRGKRVSVVPKGYRYHCRWSSLTIDTPISISMIVSMHHQLLWSRVRGCGYIDGAARKKERDARDRLAHRKEATTSLALNVSRPMSKELYKCKCNPIVKKTSLTGYLRLPSDNVHAVVTSQWHH